MKAPVYDLNGNAIGEVELPPHFDEPVRPDLIRRAVLALQTHRIVPYGVYEYAGKEHVVKLHKRRRKRYRTVYGYGISRTPRKILAIQGTYWYGVGAFAPFTRGGYRVRAPKVEKVRYERINKKERRKAIRSAIAATALEEFVKGRGHKIGRIKPPIVVVDEVEKLKKTKEVIELLKKLDLEKELERIRKKKRRAGKGKRRGRPYRRRVGPLFIVANSCDLKKAAKNIPGVDVVEVRNLNVELLAPGAKPGRLCIWSKGAIEKLRNLFS